MWTASPTADGKAGESRSGGGGAAYLGGSAKFDEANADFTETYADQTERDYTALQAAVKDGKAEASTEI